MGTLRTRPVLIVLLLWLGITALDLDKAFHIDDTFHLQAAQWIEHHPATPMSGPVHWAHDPGTIHEFNQPPGFFYLVALTGHFFGYREVPMHLMRSLFTLLALLCMYRLAGHRAPRHALLLTVLLGCCPALMVNQGLMTDVPLLAMILLFAVFLLVPGRGSPGWRHAGAALALSGAMMIKYTALPLLPVFVLALVLRREWRSLPLVLLPLGVLAAWSAWNLHEYGGIHLLDRQGGDGSVRGIFVRNLALFTALGAVSPFTPAFLGAFRRPSPANLVRGWWAALLAAAGFIAAVYLGWITETGSDQVLRILFTLNGVLLMVLAIRYLPRSVAAHTAEAWVLAAWALGLALFVTLFSPMMATRHVLLVLPPLLLLIAPALDRLLPSGRVLAVGTTAILGVLLTVSDKAYADFFRRHAAPIARQMAHQTKGTVWSLGHWGWLWYAREAGMATYSTNTSAVRPGDILVLPLDIDAQPIAYGLEIEQVARWDEAPSCPTFFNVEQFAGMYTSSYGKLPWTLSRSHHKTIIAYRVDAVR